MNNQTEAVKYYLHGLGFDLSIEETKSGVDFLVDRYGPDAVYSLDDEEVAKWIGDWIEETEDLATIKAGSLVRVLKDQVDLTRYREGKVYLKAGTVVRVTSDEGDWLFVEYIDPDKGIDIGASLSKNEALLIS